MKRIAKRGIFLWVLLGAFIIGLGLMVSSLAINAEDWVMKRNNKHVYSNGQLIGAGVVYDLNEKELSKTVDGQRVYNESPMIRKSTLHAVGDPVGFIATGVQTVYDSQLTGYSLTNGVYNIKKYGRGNDITLNIDSDICSLAYEKLNGKKGTIGVFNYKTGEIICMTSAPSYDVNNKPDDIETNEKYDGVYINRLLSGLYTPGSTFKTIVSISAIDNIPDIFSRTWNCPGYLETGDGKVICNAKHGTVDFYTALSQSCNVAFAEIAIELGTDRLTKTVNDVGLTTKVTMDGVGGSTGKFDISNTSKADLGWAGIGQYTTMVSPMQMMRVMGAVANGGVAVEPSLVKSIKNQVGIPVKLKTSKNEETIINPETATKLKEMMRNDVVTNYGEGDLKGHNLCAKSGTAQVDGKKSTAWFVGFLDDVENPYAFVVVIEEAGSGSQIAGPVAKSVLSAIVNK